MERGGRTKRKGDKKGPFWPNPSFVLTPGEGGEFVKGARSVLKEFLKKPTFLPGKRAFSVGSGETLFFKKRGKDFVQK